MEFRTIGRILPCVVALVVLAACGGSTPAGTDSGPRPDTGGGTCRVSGTYTVAGTRASGSLPGS